MSLLHEFCQERDESFIINPISAILDKQLIFENLKLEFPMDMKLIEETKDHKREFTATGYVVNPERTKLLVVFHNKLQRWLPAGGHMEPNELPHEAALREVFEETGVAAKIIVDDPDMGLKGEVDCQIPRPYSVLYQIIPANHKCPEHIHVDFVYAMEAPESELTIQTNEVAKVAWLTKNEILSFYVFILVGCFRRI
jgi:8-oxo-dGTP pyrophosphatase MutT (NUDIX family)